MLGRPSPLRSRRVLITVTALAGIVLLLGALALLDWRSHLLRDALSRQATARGQQQLLGRQIDDARQSFHRALRLDIRNAEARLALAKLEIAAGRAEHAYLELQTLTEQHPESTAAWLELARLMLDRGLIDEPEAALGQALERAPASAETFHLRAMARQRLNRYYSAWIDLQRKQALLPEADKPGSPPPSLELRAEELDKLPARVAALLPQPPLADRVARPAPTDEDRFEGGLPRERWPGALATTRHELQQSLQKSDVAAAQKIADKARRQYPHTVYGPWLQGIVQLAQNRPAEAEAALREALALAPRSRLVLTGLTKIWAQTQGAAYAGEQLTAIAERDPAYGFARHMAAVAYLKGRQPVKAETVLRQGIEQQPGMAEPYRELARFYLELDRLGDAVTVCEQGLVAHPGSSALLALRARIAAAGPDAAPAIAAYKRHLAVAPDSQESRAQLARLLATTRDDEASRQRARHLIATLELDAPLAPSVQDAAGVVLLKSGETKKALEWLKVAAANAPDEPAIRYHLAMALAKSGDKAAAKLEVQAALASERPFAERLEAQRLLRELSSGQ